MTIVETVSVGKGGDLPIPEAVQRVAGIREGSRVTVEAREGAILIRPAVDDTELYSPERKAEFLLNNAIDQADYEAACAAVRQLGLTTD